MIATSTKTVRELALELPNSTRVFEKLGIDYCCGGARSLEEACQAADLRMDDVLDSLEVAAGGVTAPSPEWPTKSLAELIDHIVRTHHRFTREEIIRLRALFEKVCAAHGRNHAELFAMRETFTRLAQELGMHLMKEEMVLFPYIVRMEESILQNEPVLPAPFGAVQNPVRMMMQEHEGAGQGLREMRECSRDYSIPADACLSYRTLYQALEGFEADLHQHIHLENNLLFPRAIALEPAH